MTSPSISQYFKATVTAISRSGSGATTTFDFLSRTEDLQLAGNGRAVLTGFNGVGMTVGQDGMPTDQTGSLTIRDGPESWGEERRFIDELFAWTPIQQSVAIYMAQDTLDTNTAAYTAVSSLPGYSSMLGVYDIDTAYTVDSQNRISQITDSTANANHATQSTDANKPVLTRADNYENLFLQSEDLSTTWTKTRSNVTANAIADPYTGVATVDLLYDDASAANNHYCYQAHDVISGVQYRISAICKRNGRDISFRFDNTGFTANSYAHFNLATGVVTSVSGGATASTPISLGDGWYYCEAFATAIATSSSIAFIYFLANPAGTTVYNGDSASGVYLGRCQMQETSADPFYQSSTTFKQHRGINGNRAAFFDGVNDYLTANGLATTLTGSDTAFTAIGVVLQNRLSSNQTFFGLGRSSSATPLHQIAMTATVNRNIRTDDAAASVTIDSVIPVTTTRILTLVFTGTAATFYIDGTAQYTLTAQDVTGLTLDRAAFGALVKNAVSDYFSGKMPFMAIYNGAMAAADITVWNTYLTRRFVSSPATTALSYTKVFQGICTNYSKAFDGSSDSVTLSISSVALPPSRPGYVIGNSITVSGTAYTPDTNVGRALPFLFGTSVQTPAIRLTTTSTPIYTIASYFKSTSGITLGYSGITQYYARDDAGNYRAISNGAGSTYSYRNHDASVDAPTAMGLTERAYLFKKTTPGIPETNSFITVNGAWRFKGQNNVGITPTGYIYFSLYEVEGTRIDSSTGEVWDYGRPGREVATAMRDKADYLSDVRGASDFWVQFVWDRAVVLKSDGNAPFVYYYAISMRLSEYDTATTDFVDAGGKAAATPESTATRTGRGEWSVSSYPSVTPAYELYGLTFAEFSATSTSDRGTAAFGISTDTTNTWSGSDNPIIDTDIVVAMPGLKDNGSGSITGSASATIQLPHHVAKALTMTNDGTDWAVSTQYNTTTYATRNAAILTTSAPMRRLIQGSFAGDQDLNQMLALLMNETVCKLIQLNDGTIAIWAWGYNQATQKIFNQENCTITGLQSADASSVINRINLSYDKRIVGVSPSLIIIQDGGYYATTIEYSSGLLTQSRAVYGRRDLKEFQFDLIADSTSANNIAEYYARSFDHPHQVVSLQVPYWEAYTLEMMDTVTVCHPSLPAYYGTASNARIPIYSGAEITYLVDEYPIRAQPYIGHVVGKSLAWSEGDAPILQMDVWLVQPLHPNAII